MGMFFENLIFFLVFKILRKYSGGLHAGKYIYCLLFSLSANVVFMLIIKYLQSFDSVVIVLAFELLSLLSAALFAPLENKNKRINGKEAMIYKIMVIAISFSLIVVSYILEYYSNPFSVPIGMAMLFNGILLVVGKLSMYSKSKKFQ